MQSVRTGFFILLCIFCCSVKSQLVWNNTYIEGRPLLLFSSILKENNFYYLTGVTFDSSNSNSYNRVYLCKIDLSGVVVNQSCFYTNLNKDYGAFHNTLIKNKSENFVLTGYERDALNRLFIAEFDANIDSVIVHEYYTPNTYLFAGKKIIQDMDGDYFVSGIRTDSGQSRANVVLVRLDSAGNKKWEKNYGGVLYESGSSMIKLNNGNLMLGAVRNDLGQPVEHANTWLLEVDTGGNIVRQWFDPNDSTYAAEGLLQTQDGGFVYGAQKKFDQTVNAVYKTATIVKTDSLFNKEWVFNDGSRSEVTGIFDLQELPDGSIIGCGNKPFYKNDSSTLSGWIVKLAADGSVIWNKTYIGLTGPFSYNYLTDVDVQSDGSIIAVGQSQKNGNTPPQVGWFLKLDSNGCEMENCLLSITEPFSSLQINIYPNPAGDYVMLGFGEDNNSRENEELEVFNGVGQRTYYSQLFPNTDAIKIETSAWANGLYYVAIKRNGIHIKSGKFIKE